MRIGFAFCFLWERRKPRLRIPVVALVSFLSNSFRPLRALVTFSCHPPWGRSGVSRDRELRLLREFRCGPASLSALCGSGVSRDCGFRLLRWFRS